MVGGGAAGLNGALVLGRARRDVLVLDAGRQSNLPAHAVGSDDAGAYVHQHLLAEDHDLAFPLGAGPG